MNFCQISLPTSLLYYWFGVKFTDAALGHLFSHHQECVITYFAFDQPKNSFCMFLVVFFHHTQLFPSASGWVIPGETAPYGSSSACWAARILGAANFLSSC